MVSYKPIANNFTSKNITDKMRESTYSTGSHATSSTQNCRCAKMNTVMLVLNVVALVLVLWQSPFSYDLNAPSDGYKQTEKRAERILEAEHVSPLEESGELYGEEGDDMYNYITLFSVNQTNNSQEEEEEEEAQPQTEQQAILEEFAFDELFHKVNNNWNQTVENMVHQYVAYTDGYNMEVTWRDEMWNEGWYKYLESIHADLNKFLNDESLSLEARECVAEDLLYWANDDFNSFLNIVKEEWDKETTKRGEALVIEV
ncbi:Plasmodium exported protein, unknown function [Plasmodium knowlesi strain H]|uniref:Uncharacterized protein n=3 Tax=Plasmodium knowlesi TaxID=5850 RepID=A0A5K1VSM4_PLAKH|nr:Plasmodium exported protein, unknown function [Plasmodium knowlesi strain H]OTN66135.1 Uncharacterized protein PKNOH_S09510400 [Plasmodium knowlesi]CAA9986277.1 Plasmodium exported protein, unknown function [Plasmodium knowlesi strain H]SBO25493.1 Plasmodium exported protein, unknown function [Plasmodium knowlesi strain H]SBO28264.1 Plasmodium exported protein, unknown function [Plasmodium knowlesi strain H]VVS75751.1 Plasmodium exported protein, unknown function [Plasmodium knowlesi strain|eukprot:XP_002257685.1 hypothetical protein, conserved in Plasmodium species [Plasmodium knowlesi strain H]